MTVLAAMTFTVVVPPQTAAQEEQQETDEASLSAEDVVRRLYDLVTFDAGTTPNWDEARSLFLEDAVIVLRSSRTESTVFSLEGWIGDFVSFIERRNVEQTGFVERIVRLKTMVFKDMASVLVLYEASIPGWERPPQQGVDLFLLTKRPEGWRIAAITNDIPDATNPVPLELQEP
jgi:hypothetical protein